MSGPAATTPRPARHLGCLAAHALSLGSIAGGGLVAATLVAALAGAWTWVQMGLSGLALLIALGLLLLARQRRWARRAALVLALFGALRLLVAAGPGRGSERPDAPIRCLYAGGGAPPSTWLAGVPERETVLLGALVGLSAKERRRHWDALGAVYEEIARERDFARSASPLLESWWVDRGQCWLAVPEGPGPFPLLVFLHGNGGSFQFYAQALARPATARGLAIAFPACGMGVYEPGVPEALLARTLETVGAAAPIDRRRVALVGLSAGAHAAFRVAWAEPGRYRAVASVSGVLPALGSERLVALRDTPTIFLHGSDDPRAPVAAVESAAAALRVAGGAVEVRIDEGADHLALLERRAEWVPWLLERVREALR